MLELAFHFLLLASLMLFCAKTPLPSGQFLDVEAPPFWWGNFSSFFLNYRIITIDYFKENILLRLGLFYFGFIILEIK